MRSPCGVGPENTISHGEHVLYGWGKDAPAMHLPDGAGFSVGPRTGIRTAILQVPAVSVCSVEQCRRQRSAVTVSAGSGTLGLLCMLAGSPKQYVTLSHAQEERFTVATALPVAPAFPAASPNLRPLAGSPSRRRCTTRSCGRRATTRACAWS